MGKSPFFNGKITIFQWENHHFSMGKSPFFNGKITIFNGTITIFNGKIHYFDWAIFKFANCECLPEGTWDK